MTLLEISLILLLAASWLVLIKVLDDKLRLKFQVEHTKRIPATGNFRIKLPRAQWDEGFKKGAFAFGITDKDDKVIMTMAVEKGE